MIIDEIKSILDNVEYETNFETISRIQVMLNSIRDDKNSHIRGIISYL